MDVAVVRRICDASKSLLSQLLNQGLTELKAPLSDSLIAKGDPAHRQHFFRITEAHGEAKITKRND